MAWLLREIEALLPPEGRALLLESEGMYPLAVFSREAPVEQEALACRLEEARARFGARICCAAGAPEADLLRSIRASLAHCKALLEYSFYLPPPCVIADGGLQTDAGKRVNRGLLEEMRSSVFRGDPAAAACAVEAVRREAQTPPYMPVQRLLYTLHAEWVNMADAAKLQDAQHMELAERAAAASQRSPGYRRVLFRVLRARRGARAGGARAVCARRKRPHRALPGLFERALQRSAVDPGGMARKLHFSAGYFGNLFKQAQGESFVRYLNRLRISKAQELLATSDLRVYEVAEQTGFANVNYFIRVFNQHTQMSPNRYRMLYAARRDEK